jgi:membrane-associated progesterone receptor component
MSHGGVDLGSIPPEALEGVKSGKISLADLFSGVKTNFITDYEALLSEDYQARIREEGFGVLIESLNDGNLVLMALCFFSTIFLMLFFQEAVFGAPSRDDADEDEDEEEKVPPRDFTIVQLRDYDGVKNEKIYIAMRGEVYDVSDARDYYGVNSSYHCFAGRDASRAMAKLSFDEEELSNQNLDDLGIFERDVLQNWIDKFKYSKQYPIVGKLSFPHLGESKRVFTVAELAKFKGDKPSTEAASAAATEEEDSTAEGVKSVPNSTPDCSVAQDLHPGRVNREILMCVRGKVFDVSYGGVDMYGAGGPYHIFAGIDASRALAKMSFDAEDLSSRDLSDLTESQVKVLDDWERKYLERKKYPVVGVMEGAEAAASDALYVIPENMRRTKAPTQ